MIKDYSTENIRNICVIGHGGTGKTTIVENLLYFAGAIPKLGNVNNGTSTSDFEEEEIQHKHSIHNSLTFCEFMDTKLNIIDTPGIPDFVGEVRAALRVSEGALVVVDSVDGIQMGTRKIWEYADEYKVPRIVFLNKMDKDRADFESIVSRIQKKFETPIIPIEIPIGQGEKFEGVIDLVLMKALYPKADKSGVEMKDIPAEYMDQAKKYRQDLAEIVADVDEKFVDKILDGSDLTDDEIARAVHECTLQFKLIPLVCGSADKAIGIMTLLKMMVKFLPSPKFVGETIGNAPGNEEDLIARHPDINEPFTAFVYKTRVDQYAGKFSYFRVRSGIIEKDMEVIDANTGQKEKLSHLYSIMGKKQVEVDKVIAGDIGVVAKSEIMNTGHSLCDPKKELICLPPLKIPKPIYSLAVSPESKGDEDKMMASLQKIASEDPTFKVDYNNETQETIISGMGEIQLNIVLEQLKQKNNLNLKAALPKIAYRETITKSVKTAYRHKKQTGGHGQFGEVEIEILPEENGKGFVFEDNIVGGAIPKTYIPGVEKGLIEAMEEGPLAKYPVTDIKVKLVDGSHHPVDSSELSFKLAGYHALKQAYEEASPILLEPVMVTDIHVDKDTLGDILGDIQGRRGKVLGVEGKEDNISQTVKAQIPLAELLEYANVIRSLTRDRATFEMEFSHYEPCLGKIADQVVNKRNEEA